MEPSCSPCRRLFLLLLLLRLPTLSFASVPAAKTINVDQRGGGDFTTVQSAVDSVPDGNREWIRIHVKEGSYREKVTIPKKKGYILLEGDSSSKTDINFDAHAHAHSDDIDQLMLAGGTSLSPTFGSATFTVLADNFVARNISFKNMYNAFNKSKADQAVAALVGGDKSAFYDCAFHGFQDTLCDYAGHYFRRCSIEGGVDFIWGYGQSIYDGCVVVSNLPPSYRQPGWVTAHARLNAGSSGGLVFRGGTILGSGRQYLGRAWNQYATVVFYRTHMDGIVVPQGWQPWRADDPSTTMYAEVECTGPGADTAGRVPWEKHPSQEQLKMFVDIKFIDDGSLSMQP